MSGVAAANFGDLPHGNEGWIAKVRVSLTSANRDVVGGPQGPRFMQQPRIGKRKSGLVTGCLLLRAEAVAQTTAVVAEAQRFGSGCGMRERTMCLESEIPDLRAKVRVGAAASARTIVATPQAISGASPLCNSLGYKQQRTGSARRCFSGGQRETAGCR